MKICVWAALCVIMSSAYSQSLPQPPTDADDSQQTSQPQADSDRRDRFYYSDETESAGPLGRKFLLNVLEDQKDIWTMPFHMRRRSAVSLIMVGVGAGALFATDHMSSRALPNSLDQISLSKKVSNLGAAYTVLPITIGMYLGGVIGHNAKARETGVLSAEAIVDTLIDVDILKVAFRRSRPFQTNGNGAFFGGGDSFPSGHAAESWALASVVAHEYHHNILVPITAYTLATAVTLSRLSGQQHFASDLLVGSAIGWFTGRYVYNNHVNHGIHVHSHPALKALRPQVIPRFDGLSQTRGVVLSWDLNRYKQAR